MRITYLHQYFNTPSMIGGTRSYEMARRLVAAGHEVDMVTSWREPSTQRGWFETVESGISVHWLPVPYSNHLSHRQRLSAFVRFASAAARKAARLEGDVVFATSTPLTIALPGVYAARRRRVPLVLEIRDLWPEVPIAMGALRHWAPLAAARWLERFAYANASHIVALSPGMKAGIVATGYPAERVAVIPNAADLDLFDVGPAPGRAVRDAHPWLLDRPLVLYTGTIGPLNGVGYLARLAAAVQPLAPDVRFVVIGDGKESDAVRRLAASLDVLGRTFFLLPGVPKTQLPGWLSTATVLTSVVIDRKALWANSANKVFDGFAAGRPVAINHEGWLADLLRETGAGLVLDARDYDAAAAALVAALRDREGLARAARSAHQLARERFSRDRLSAQLESMLVAAVTHLGPAGSAAPSPAAGSVAA